MSDQKWTSQETARISALRDQGLPPSAIARQMQREGCRRTHEAICRKVHRQDRGEFVDPVSDPLVVKHTMPPVPGEGEHIVGCISDTHLPFSHPSYLDFCQETFDAHHVNTIVHMGDFVDNHAMSFHPTDPDGLGAGDEFGEAMCQAREWYEAFPVVKWVTGNHDRIPQRRVKAAGLSQCAW